MHTIALKSHQLILESKKANKASTVKAAALMDNK